MRFQKLVLSLVCLFVTGAVMAQDMDSVVIDYFYEPGCPECIKVKNEIMPELEERFEGFYLLRKYDLGAKTNVIRLAAYQEALGIKDNEPVSMIVDYQHVFNGFAAIKSGLFDRIDESVAARMEEGWQEPTPIAVEGDISIVEQRLSKFTVPAILLAGFLDGINPCVISVLVFFLSFLAATKMHGRNLIMMGCSFCVASFVTYTAMGLGLLKVLHLFWAFKYIRTGIEWAMIAALTVFAILALYDAYRYMKLGMAAGAVCKLPMGVIGRIRKSFEKGVNGRNLIIGGLICGSAATAFEALCTGQVYLPTLVLMLDSSKSGMKAWSYLLLYNAACICPLVIAFILSYLGHESDRVQEWSDKHAAASKALLGVLFLILAALIFFL